MKERKIKLTVTSARPLTEEQKEKVEAVFSKKYDCPLEANYLVDDSLIGGLMVFDGATIYDGTVKSKINQIKEKLGND